MGGSSSALFRRLSRRWRQRWRSFTSPTDALPVDLVRALVGLVSVAYFWRTHLEAPAFSGPEGLIDHRLARTIFWYTRLSLFHPRLGLRGFRAVYLLAVAGSLLLAAGVWPRPVSALLYATAVSTYRWNFPVAYVDDGVMHLMLLWMALLPTGRTLALPEWLSQRRRAVARWKVAQVPGAAVCCFLANLALIYLVAGLWKWTSPLWRQGMAVYAVLKTAVARTPDRWRPEHVPALSVAGYAALALEPLIPVAFVLPPRHPLKWLLGAAMAVFHGGIIATMQVPFANLACLATAPLIFRHEIMARLRGESAGAAERPQDTTAGTTGETAAGTFDLSAKAAALLVTCLVLAMLWETLRPHWRSGTHPAVRANRQWAGRSVSAHHNPFYSVLWLAGLAQSYRLFDWIDEMNYHITYDVVERREDGATRRLDDRALFPRSLRSSLLQSYLHDIMWMKVPRPHLAGLQRSLFERYTRRFCRRCPDSGWIEVIAHVQRTTRDNLRLGRTVGLPFLTFRCRDGEPQVRFARLATE